MSGHSQARPAAVSDFDDAADMEKPGIIREARTGRSTVIRQPNPPSRTASRSGSIRGRSNTVAGQNDLTIRSRTPATTATVVQGSRSVSRSQVPSMAAPLGRSSSATRRPSTACSDPTCDDVHCQSERNTDRRYVLKRPGVVPLQTAAPIHGHSSAQSQTAASGTAPCARANSSATLRPQSWAGAPYYAHYAMPFAAPPPAPRGPPPSPSAYRNMPQYPPYQTQPPYTTHLPYSHSSSYIAPAPSYLPSPTDQQPFPARYNAPPLPVQSPINEMYNPRLSSHTDLPPAVREPPRLVRSGSMHARASLMPGSFPDEAISDSSDTDDYEDNYSPRKRDSMMMPPPRIPAPPVARPTARVTTQPGHRISGSHSRSSSYVDSDRTPRQSDVRRQSSSASSRSRHHSVSTGASSLRTPATTISTGSRGDYVTIEDKYGRRQFLSAEDYVRLQRYQEQQQAKAQQTVDAEVYQNAVRGGASEDITVDKIRQFIDAPVPRSRASAHSRKSGQSGTQSEGIKISYGETTMHVTGGARVELHNDADGGAHFVINPGLGREKPYYTETSKSSESRVGRSRGSDTGHRRRSTLEPVYD